MTVFVLLAMLLGACAFALLTRRVWWWRGGDGRPPGTEAAPHPPKRLLGALAALMLAVVCGGYAWLGSPASLPLTPEAAALAASAGRNAPARTAEQIADLIDQLTARLKQRPDDAIGWGLLARTYVSLGRHADAELAYQKALALRQDDPDLLADYANVLAVKNGNSLEGEPARLIDRALAADPGHVKALTLSGMAAFNRQDHAGAAASWEKALQAAPPDGAFAGRLRAGITQARQLAGIGASSGAIATTGPVAPPGATRTGPVATADAGSAASRVSGTVSLARALAARAAPQDAVFVFARAADGARVPLAVLRKQVRDLPFEFVLDDSLAISAAAKLSSARHVVIGARISKSGNATRQSGDLQGSVGPVPVGTAGLKIEISDVVAESMR